MRRWEDGAVLTRNELGPAVEAAFGAPHLHLHRADLLQALQDALPSDRIHLGRRCVAVDEDRDRPAAEFEDGSSVDADLLLGADGIHSVVRAALFGPESPRFCGSLAYRCLVPAERVAHLPLEQTASAWLGPGRHFVHYFVSAGRFLNCVAVVPAGDWTRESWSDLGQIEEQRTQFAGWHELVAQILAETTETWKWGSTIASRSRAGRPER